jgi:hypothetical protein
VIHDEMEFEIQCEHDGGMSGLDKSHVHIRRFAVWELERKRLRGRPDIAASGRQIAYIIRCETCGYVDERATRAGAVEAALRHRDAASSKEHQVTIVDPRAKTQ